MEIIDISAALERLNAEIQAAREQQRVATERLDYLCTIRAALMTIVRRPTITEGA